MRTQKYKTTTRSARCRSIASRLVKESSRNGHNISAGKIKYRQTRWPIATGRPEYIITQKGLFELKYKYVRKVGIKQ
jgi:hypothetical protein